MENKKKGFGYNFMRGLVSMIVIGLIIFCLPMLFKIFVGVVDIITTGDVVHKYEDFGILNDIQIWGTIIIIFFAIPISLIYAGNKMEK